MMILEKQIFLLFLFSCFLSMGLAHASDSDRFLKAKAWQCNFQAQLKSERNEATGPGGMAHGPKRQLFQALAATGVKAENPGGNTDSYQQTFEQTAKGKIRLHHIYDGGPDGIQIAGWDNGEAEVHVKNYFQGTEQNKTILRDKTATYNGTAKFEGEEYEPPFQIWIYPDQGTYSIEYHLSPVRGQQIEHCHMNEAMEGGRKKLASATDADMPLGGLFGGLTNFTCPTERKSELDIDGGALSALLENQPIPSSGLVFEGEGESQFVDTKGVKVRWSCQPE